MAIRPVPQKKRKPARARTSTAPQPKTATSKVRAEPANRTVVAAPPELLAGLVEDINTSAGRAIEEICAAARCLDKAGHEDGAQFILYAIGKIDAIRMSAAELRGVLYREMKAEVQP
jgi:hypothetical protein